ncbi:Unknown protein sequence [Pseudomonas syringae pv. cilantro]|uniref:Uncharacterized protein n=1 Tax=Pseudomonas syringae pv. cilantro TaxID=81035 RepID=A0A0N0XA72_PSESX|nr:Unknown protein sequence [Pseudomonas syringae pv. cilantro]
MQADHSVGSAIQSKGQLSPDFTAHSGGAGWHGFSSSLLSSALDNNSNNPRWQSRRI